MHGLLLRVVLWLKWLLSTIVHPLVALWGLVLRRIHQVRLAEKMPGPRSYPLVGVVTGPKSYSPEDIFNFAVESAEKWGRSFRYYMGPLIFVHSGEPQDLEVLLSGYKYIEKCFMYRILYPWLGQGLTSTGENWRSRRKVLTPAFHFKILDQFMPVFHSCGDVFIRQLRKRADGTAFDVCPLVQLLTLDVICETAMGVTINAQTDIDSVYAKAVKEVSHITCSRSWQPWYYFDFIFMNLPIGRRYKKMLNIVHGTTEKVIRDRKVELDSMRGQNITLDVDEIGRRRRVAFLDLLLLSARDGSLSDADIREEVDTFMFAGHDTTASAISFAIFVLSRHPDVQEKIHKELESVFDPHKALKPSLQQLSELKYLEMVIKESIRLYSPVPIIFRSNPEDTKLISGHTIPVDCSMSISPFQQHRDPDLFPDPEKFIPERFSSDESARRHPYAYIPFSAGPRNCIGQRFAILELKNVLAKVVWNFRILPVADFEPRLTWELTLKSVNGLPVRLEIRRQL